MNHTDEKASSVPKKPTTSGVNPQKKRTSWPIPKTHMLIALTIFIIISLLLFINQAIEKTPNLASFANRPSQYATTTPQSTTDDSAMATDDTAVNNPPTESSAVTAPDETSQTIASSSTVTPSATADDASSATNESMITADEAPVAAASTSTNQLATSPSTVTSSATITDEPSNNATASPAPPVASSAPLAAAKPLSATTPTQRQAVTDNTKQAANPVKSPVSRAPLKSESNLSYSKAPGHYFTIQLSGSYQENRVRHFAEQNHLQGYWVYQTQHNGKPWFVLVDGIYPNLQAARSALANLPKPLQKEKPWPKTLKQVQQELKK